jgi:hypothetical protein
MSAKPAAPTGQRRRGLARRKPRGPLGSAGRQKPLYRADDSGDGVHLPPRLFGGSDVEGWGRAFESFQRLNESAFKALALTPRFESTPRGPELKLFPGAHVGAIPLRSGTSGHVVAGFVVRPRFGWSGSDPSSRTPGGTPRRTFCRCRWCQEAAVRCPRGYSRVQCSRGCAGFSMP